MGKPIGSVVQEQPARLVLTPGLGLVVEGFVVALHLRTVDPST